MTGCGLVDGPASVENALQFPGDDSMDQAERIGWAAKFQHREGWAWLVSLAWLFVCAGAFAWFGWDFDPDATLGYQDWSDIGTVVSAVMAPIAVLWVVRSFYVQKRELAAAVQAASEQAKRLEEQNLLLQAQLDAGVVPDVQASLAIPSSGNRMDVGNYRDCVVTFKNAAAGSAYKVSALAVNVCGEAVYSMHPLQVDKCILGKEKTVVTFRITHPDASKPTLLIRLRTSDSLGRSYENYWCELPSGSFEPVFKQTFIERTYNAKLPD